MTALVSFTMATTLTVTEDMDQDEMIRLAHQNICSSYNSVHALMGDMAGTVEYTTNN